MIILHLPHQDSDKGQPVKSSTSFVRLAGVSFMVKAIKFGDSYQIYINITRENN